MIVLQSALIGGLTGLAAAWWVATQAQLAQAQGKLVFEEKPRFTHNCTYNFVPAPFSNVTTDR